MYDAIIVGASVAGSSLAALLGPRGVRTLLVDRAVFPRRKVCGEGLMPAGVRILERFGLAVQARLLGAKPFTGLRFHISPRHSMELDFTELDGSLRGLAMARESLDTMLLSHAESQPGVEVRQGFNVRGFRTLKNRVEVWGENGEVLTARVLVGADGIRSRFPKVFGICRTNPRNGRFALRASFDGLRGMDGLVEVFCSPKAEAYVSPMGEERARVTLLIDGPPDTHRKPADDLYSRVLRGFPSLIERMRSLQPEEGIEATSPVCQRLQRCHGTRLLLVGDAAGAVDPVTGQGMTVALRDALLAAEVLAPALSRDALEREDLAIYSQRRELHFQVSYELAQNLLFVLRRPFVARQAARAISRNSRLRRRLLALATESQPQPPLTHLEHLRLLFGF